MQLEAFTALDEQVTREDWELTPSSVRQLLRWLFETYEERLADLEEEKVLSKVETEVAAKEKREAAAAEVAESKELGCSFCGKKQNEVLKLISGPNIHICNECIEICNAILANDAR